MIIANDIVKSYGTLQVLKGVSIAIDSGELIAIVGSSGAGKSTLLHILGTLDKADSGLLKIENIQISNLKSRQLSSFRNQKIGFIFQFHYLLPEFSALENICIPAYIKGTSKRKPHNALWNF